MPVLYALASVLGFLKIAFFGAAVVVAVVVAIDWMVRTRRINPFSPVARFFRTSVDPLLAPIERRVVAAGGMPTSAPWWALVAVVVGGIITITALEFVLGQVASLLMASQQGGRGLVRFLVEAIFTLLNAALFVRIISSWFGVSPYSRWVNWSYRLTEPILAPLRQVIPNFGPLDVTPIVAYFLLRLVAGFIIGAI